MRTKRTVTALLTAAAAIGMLSGAVKAEQFTFPLEETATFTGMISYPSGTEEDQNKRTIFKRLEEQTNVHIEWTAISSDQWGD